MSLTRQRIFSYLRYSFVTRHRSATIECILFDRRYDRIAFLPSNRLVATSLLPACKYRETTLGNPQIGRNDTVDTDRRDRTTRRKPQLGSEILTWPIISAGNARIPARRRRLRVDDYLPRSLDRNPLSSVKIEGLTVTVVERVKRVSFAFGLYSNILEFVPRNSLLRTSRVCRADEYFLSGIETVKENSIIT